MSARIGVGKARAGASAKTLVLGLPLALSAMCVVPTSASASGDDAVKAANNATQAAVAAAVEMARDQARLLALGVRPAGRPAIGFSGDPYAQVYDPFEALGYAKSGMVTKAPRGLRRRHRAISSPVGDKARLIARSAISHSSA